MEEPVTLDSGEGTLEHSMHHLPQPPPRHESYMLKNTAGTDGSGSENYEHLPTRSLNSLNGPDDSIKLNLNENNDKYRHLYMLGEKDISMDDTYDDDKDDEKARLLHQGKENTRGTPNRHTISSLCLILLLPSVLLVN